MANAKIHSNSWNDIFTYMEGKIFWKIKPMARIFIGKEASNRHLNNKTGVVQNQVTYKGSKYHRSRVVYEMFNGNISDETLVVDHINGNRDDDRIENLRLISRRSNNCNTRIHRDGKCVGATYHKRLKKWQASIVINNKKTYLGYYQTEEDASSAYFKALEDPETFISNLNAMRKERYEKTGRLKGTMFNKQCKKWSAHIYINGKRKYLGLYLTEKEAHEAYLKENSQREMSQSSILVL